MEILALYTSPDALTTALAAGARHLAATLEGFALIYLHGSPAGEPDGWAGFTCAKDAVVAGTSLEAFRSQTAHSERPLRCDAPEDPPRVWSRASGGVFGFPLRHGEQTRGTAIVGCPGPWPRMQNGEIESILRQITLVLDHHAVSKNEHDSPEPSDEALQLSEQLFAQDLQLMKQEERIDRVERLKNDLIEKMSIELRGPLNQIISQIIAVLAGEHESLSEAGRQALRKSLDDGNTLLRILQNIVDLWRLRQGGVHVEAQEVNLSEVLDEAIFNVRDSVRPGVTLEKRLAASLPKVQTDLGKLNQILFHLLDNSAKFTLDGRITLEVSVEEGQLLCTITDSGIGIATDDQERVFEEFFQVDSSPESIHRGAGLGLSLAHGLIEQLGGAISFTSEIGQGTQFSFTLPVATY